MAPHSSTLAWKIHGWGSLVGCSPWVAESWTWLSDFTFTFHFHALEKEMATHSSVLAWRIPGTGEPGGLLSMGSHRVVHDWSDLAVAAAKDCFLLFFAGNWLLKVIKDRLFVVVVVCLFLKQIFLLFQSFCSFWKGGWKLENIEAIIFQIWFFHSKSRYLV